MTAKEMFEKLGYKLRLQTDKHYEATIWHYDTGIYVRFNYYSKTVETPNSIGLDMFKAITQQMKELGWIE